MFDNLIVFLLFKVFDCAGSGCAAMDPKLLLNLTNAYLAVEDMLKSDVISPETRRRLERILDLLDSESRDVMREYEQDPGNSSRAAD